MSQDNKLRLTIVKAKTIGLMQSVGSRRWKDLKLHTLMFGDQDGLLYGW